MKYTITLALVAAIVASCVEFASANTGRLAASAALVKAFPQVGQGGRGQGGRGQGGRGQGGRGEGARGGARGGVGGQTGRGQGGPGSVDPRFEEAQPTIGDSLPEVTLYDADGQPIELAQLKGSYSVLVFGCLT